MARLTADVDGLLVHHCLANRRDLHAEYPPGAAPHPDAMELAAQDGVVSSNKLVRACLGGGALAESQPPEPSEPLDAARAARTRSPVASIAHEQAGKAAGEGNHTGTGQALDASGGRLQFPWECGPLLEALLHGSADAGAVLAIGELPAPAPEGRVRTSDVVHALIAAGVLVAA
jgi:hypothetical protein